MHDFKSTDLKKKVVKEGAPQWLVLAQPSIYPYVDLAKQA